MRGYKHIGNAAYQHIDAEKELCRILQEELNKAVFEERNPEVRIVNGKGDYTIKEIKNYIKSISNINRSFKKPTGQINFTFELVYDKRDYYLT
jgi:ribosomal protein S19E (S16A)